MDPAAGGVKPMIERTVVVLPMPLRPSSETISPRPMISRMPDNTRLNPSLVSMSRNSRRAVELSAIGRAFAEISFAYCGIGTNCCRIAGRDDATVDQDADTVRQRKHGINVVLDQHDGDGALECPE